MTTHRYYAWKPLDDPERRESTCRAPDCDWRLTGTIRALGMAQREHARTGGMGGDELARVEFAHEEAHDRAVWEHYRAHDNQSTQGAQQ